MQLQQGPLEDIGFQGAQNQPSHDGLPVTPLTVLTPLDQMRQAPSASHSSVAECGAKEGGTAHHCALQCLQSVMGRGRVPDGKHKRLDNSPTLFSSTHLFFSTIISVISVRVYLPLQLAVVLISHDALGPTSTHSSQHAWIKLTHQCI